MATPISTVTPYAGQTPAKEQEDNVFDTNIDDELTYINTLPVQLNTTIGELNTFGGEMESLGAEVEANASSAANSKSNAAASESAAEGFKDSAEAAAIAAQAGAGLPAMTQNGDVLTITDAGTNAVAFQTPSKGGLVPLLTVNASGDSAIDFTGLDTYGYKNYKVTVNVSTSTPSSVVQLNVRLSNDDGLTFDSSTDYDGCYTVKNETSSSVNLTPSSNQTFIFFGQTSGSGINCDGSIDIYSNTESSISTQIRCFCIGDGNVILRAYESFFRKSTAQVNNAIRIFPASGTITGTLTLYGVSEA